MTRLFDRLMWSMKYLQWRKALHSRRKQKQLLGYNYKPLNQVRSLIGMVYRADENNR